MIERVKLQDKIRNYADDLIIDHIGETEIALFASKSKSIVEYAFEEYVNEQYSLYHSRVKTEKQKEYSNFTDGYVAQMRQWVSNHGIDLNPVELEEPRAVVSSQDTHPQSRNHKKLALGGTAIAAGILLLPRIITLPACIASLSSIAAIAIEIIALGLAYREYKKKNNIIDNSKAIQDQEIGNNLNILKEKLIVGIWNQLDLWLDEAVKESDSLIKNFVYNE